MRILPPITTKLTMIHNAWIVGSAAFQTDPRDIDILVPFASWPEAACLIPDNARPNTFGGWKFMDDNIEVDVWPGDMGWFLTQNMCRTIWHPKSGIKYTRTD